MTKKEAKAIYEDIQRRYPLLLQPKMRDDVFEWVIAFYDPRREGGAVMLDATDWPKYEALLRSEGRIP